MADKKSNLIRHKYVEVTDKRMAKMKNLVSSRKYDGGNYFLHYDEHGSPSFLSRRVSVKDGSIINRVHQVPHLAKKMPELAGHEYNVELYHSGMSRDGKDRHNILSGILTSLPPKAIETQRRVGPVRAVVFDVLHPPHSTYAEKIESMRKLEAAFGDPSLLHAPDFHYGYQGLEALDKRTQESGHEGWIATDLTAPESENVRIKKKHYQTYNLVVIGFTQEYDIHGNPKQAAGALSLADSTGRHVGDTGIGLSREDRIDIFNNPEKWLGKLVQVRALPPTSSKLRHSVYNGEGDGGLDKIASENEPMVHYHGGVPLPLGKFDIQLIHHHHKADKAGEHTDWRVVIGDKAFSWATKKGIPKPGEKLVLWEQPVHTAEYAVTPHIIHPPGTYGAGEAKHSYNQKGTAEINGHSFKLRLENGDRFTVVRMPDFGKGAWLLIAPKTKE